MVTKIVCVHVYVCSRAGGVDTFYILGIYPMLLLTFINMTPTNSDKVKSQEVRGQ